MFVYVFHFLSFYLARSFVRSSRFAEMIKLCIARIYCTVVYILCAPELQWRQYKEEEEPGGKINTIVGLCMACVYHFYIYTVDESLFSRCSQQHSHKQ